MATKTWWNLEYLALKYRKKSEDCQINESDGYQDTVKLGVFGIKIKTFAFCLNGGFCTVKIGQRHAFTVVPDFSY